MTGFLSSLQDFGWRMTYRLGFPVAKVWWFISKARNEGALVATYVGRDILLLRESYRRTWNFPGGGLKPFETPGQAARREFEEEIGVPAPNLTFKRTVEGFWDWRRDKVHFFEIHLNELPPIKIDNRETVEARLVSPEELANMALTGPLMAYLYGDGARKQAAMPLEPDRLRLTRSS